MSTEHEVIVSQWMTDHSQSGVLGINIFWMVHEYGIGMDSIHEHWLPHTCAESSHIYQIYQTIAKIVVSAHMLVPDC